MPAADPLTLRNRLRALQADTLRQLAAADRIDAGMLELVAHIGTALAALDAEAVEAVSPEPGDRCIVSDDGHKIAVTIYSADRRCAAAVLPPIIALRLASQLTIAALRRL